MTTARADRLKVRRRALLLGDGRFTVLSLRAGAPGRFAARNDDGRWSLVTDVKGASLLARVIWAMAFQQRERTVFVIEGAVLADGPEGAGAEGGLPMPIVVANDELGPFGEGAARALVAELPFTGEADGTVALQTRGLDLALGELDAFRDRERTARRDLGRQRRRWVEEVGGVLVLSAPPAVLREWGVEISLLEKRFESAGGSEALSWPRSSGEVRIESDLRAR